MALPHPPAVRPLKDSLLSHGRFLVERAMQGHGLTVTSLALRLGISRKHLSNILGAKVPLSENLTDRLAAELQLDPELLRVLRHDGIVPRERSGRSPFGVILLGNPTEPMTDWFES